MNVPGRCARTILIPALVLGFIPQLADAQRIKNPSLCYLAYAPSSLHDDAFVRGLVDLGYTPGRTITIHFLFADGHFDRFPHIADECIRRRPDVIVALTTPGVLSAKKATTTVPIVFGPVGDPVGTGIVSSLARPGGNATGVTQMGPGLSAKRLELLKEALPALTRVSILANMSDPIAASQVAEFEKTAARLGMRARVRAVQNLEQFDAAFRGAAKDQDEAVITTIETIFLVQRAHLVDLANKYRLPVMSPYREVAEAGALLSYGPNRPALYGRMAVFVDKILNGAKPANLPVEQPSQFEFIVNLRAAAGLGLGISPQFLLRADHVIR